MKTRQEPISGLEWIAWGMLGITLLISMFNNGIFQGYGVWATNQVQFEKPMLYELIVMSLFALWSSIVIIQKKLELKKSVLLGIAGLIMPLTYAISSIGAQSHYLAKFGFLVACMAFIMFFSGSLLQSYERFLRSFPMLYIIFGYLIIIYGFTVLIGNAYLLDSLASVNGIRMSSIFQYPNGYAVFLMTIWFCVLVQMMKVKSPLVFHILAASMVPILLSFLLTLSRGAIFVLPIIAVLALLMFKLKQQLMIVFYSLFALLVAFIVYTPIADRGYDVALQISNAIYNKQPIQTVSFFFSKSIQTWGLLIGATLAFGLLSYTYGRFLSSKLHLSKLESNNRYRIIIPGIIVLLTIFGVLLITSSSILNLFPTFISDRLGDVSYKTQSVYERLTMYKDAFSLWKTAPMLGGGGGAWDASYQTYQSYPYLSNKTHSYPMQLLVETGALGFLLYLLLIAGVFYVFYKFYRKASHTQRLNYVPFYLIALTILVHSLIDFEMSYGLNVILVYLCLGVLGGTLNKPLYNKVKEIKQSLSIKKVISSGMTIVFLLVIVMTGMQLAGYNNYMSSVEATARNDIFTEITSKLDKARKTAPNHPDILYQLVALNYQAYKQSQDPEYLQEAKKYLDLLLDKEPNFRPVVDMNYLITLSLGDRERAMGIMKEAIAKYPFITNFYSQYADDLLKDYQNSEGNSVIGEQLIELYKQMQAKDQIVKNLPESFLLGNAFEISSSVREGAAYVMYANGGYEEAIAVLKPGLLDDLSNEDNQRLALLYLSALQKTGSNDEELLNKLQQVNSSTKEQLQDPLKALKGSDQKNEN